MIYHYNRIGHPRDHYAKEILNYCTVPRSLSREYRRMDRTNEPFMGPVAQIAAGRNISAFVTESGQLWTCGKNETGALGTGDFESHPIPVRIEAPFGTERVRKVACGTYHMIALTDSGRVFTWVGLRATRRTPSSDGDQGVGNHGQCGRSPRTGRLNPKSYGNRRSHESFTIYSFHPEQILPWVNARDVFAGGHYSAVITDDGQCLVLGGSADDPDAFVPKMPFGADAVESIGTFA